MKLQHRLLLLTLLFCGNVSALEWETVEVFRIIDTEHLLLRDERIVKMIGYDGPDLNFPTLQERSSARPTFQLMKLLLEGEQAKILEDKTKCEHGRCQMHVKTMEGNYLTELLLKKGLGKFRTDDENVHFDKKYQVAEDYAQENKLGQWGETSWQKSSNRVRELAGVSTLSWRNKFGHYLAPISIGRVTSVENGNTFHLESGLCVKLLGVDIPTPKDSRRGHSCFGKESKKYLSNLILGKKVELRKDISQLDNRKCLQRHVWLQGKYGELNGDIHVNEKMLLDGYGRSNIPTENKQYHKEFATLQKKVYENPNGAWLECAREIISRNSPKADRPTDANCPIKVSSTGKYHTPASSWYGRLNATQCFNSEKEALDAGHEKAN